CGLINPDRPAQMAEIRAQSHRYTGSLRVIPVGAARSRRQLIFETGHSRLCQDGRNRLIAAVVTEQLPSMENGHREMAEITISNVMKAYAQDAERLASEQGISLDYTEESLERVDLLLHEITGDTILTPRTPEEAGQLWALAKIYGGYLGE